jgi:hypothetical protein
MGAFAHLKWKKFRVPIGELVDVLVVVSRDMDRCFSDEKADQEGCPKVDDDRLLARKKSRSPDDLNA